MISLQITCHCLKTAFHAQEFFIWTALCVSYFCFHFKAISKAICISGFYLVAYKVSFIARPNNQKWRIRWEIHLSWYLIFLSYGVLTFPVQTAVSFDPLSQANKNPYSVSDFWLEMHFQNHKLARTFLDLNMKMLQLTKEYELEIASESQSSEENVVNPEEENAHLKIWNLKVTQTTPKQFWR